MLTSSFPSYQASLHGLDLAKIQTGEDWELVIDTRDRMQQP
jgi:hypothetical protein